MCARCTGMYLGSSMAFLFLVARGRVLAGQFPRRWILAVFCILAAAFAIDGLNSYLTFFPGVPHLYAPNNTLRLLTGTGLGLGIGVMVVPGFNQAVWTHVDGSRSLTSWTSTSLGRPRSPMCAITTWRRSGICWREERFARRNDKWQTLALAFPPGQV